MVVWICLECCSGRCHSPKEVFNCVSIRLRTDESKDHATAHLYYLHSRLGLEIHDDVMHPSGNVSTRQSVRLSAHFMMKLAAMYTIQSATMHPLVCCEQGKHTLGLLRCIRMVAARTFTPGGVLRPARWLPRDGDKEQSG